MKATYLGSSEIHHTTQRNRVEIPFYTDLVSAGFPSPAQDFVERTLDLNELCIDHPAATFFVRVQGDSMIDAGIESEDVLVVDRSLTAKHGDIVIASVFGELTVKELQLKPNLVLYPHNAAYTPIAITEDSDFEIFGVVTSIVRKLKK